MSWPPRPGGGSGGRGWQLGCFEYNCEPRGRTRARNGAGPGLPRGHGQAMGSTAARTGQTITGTCLTAESEPRGPPRAAGLVAATPRPGGGAGPGLAWVCLAARGPLSRVSFSCSGVAAGAEHADQRGLGRGQARQRALNLPGGRRGGVSAWPRGSGPAAPSRFLFKCVAPRRGRTSAPGLKGGRVPSPSRGPGHGRAARPISRRPVTGSRRPRRLGPARPARPAPS